MKAAWRNTEGPVRRPIPLIPLNNRSFSRPVVIIPLFLLLLASPGASAERVHVVGEGETLSSIALDELGDASIWPSLAAANGIPSPYLIHPGDEIVIPSGGSEPETGGSSGQAEGSAAGAAPDAAAPDAAPGAETPSDAATEGLNNPGEAAFALISGSRPAEGFERIGGNDTWISDSEVRSPALDALIERAYRHSPIMARARAVARGGAAGEALAGAMYMPVIGVSENYSTTDNAPMAFMSILQEGRMTPAVQMRANDPGTVEDWATRLYVNYRIYDFGRREALVSAAEAEAERTAILEEAARRDVRYAVTSAYLDLVEHRAEVDLWLKTVELFTAHEEMVSAHYEAGTVLRSDLLSIRVAEASARENLVSARYSAEIALEKLADAVGIPAASIDLPATALGIRPYDANEEELVAAARNEHPLIAAMGAAARAAASARDAAARGNLPVISATARGEWHGDDESFGTERESAFAGVSIDFPFFDGGRTRAEREAAEARLEETEAMRAAAESSLELAARTAHRRALEARSRITIADESVEAASEALRIIEERYAAGLSDIVELIEAERSLTEARTRALEARANLGKALAAVERLAGGRWNDHE